MASHSVSPSVKMGGPEKHFARGICEMRDQNKRLFRGKTVGRELLFRRYIRISKPLPADRNCPVRYNASIPVHDSLSAEDFPMSHGDSVTYWLDELKAGDYHPIQRLWDRYFPMTRYRARRSAFLDSVSQARLGESAV